jgi:hypothetical protein
LPMPWTMWKSTSTVLPYRPTGEVECSSPSSQ